MSEYKIPTDIDREFMDEQTETMNIFGLATKDVENIKCTCACHHPANDMNWIMHMFPCCNNGWITIRK